MLEFEKRPRNEDGNIEPWRENTPWPDKIDPATNEPYGLIPLEDILAMDEAMRIEFESKASDDDNNGFKFMYESDTED